jgi:hypothetical protein
MGESTGRSRSYFCLSFRRYRIRHFQDWEHPRYVTIFLAWQEQSEEGDVQHLNNDGQENARLEDERCCGPLS